MVGLGHQVLGVLLETGGCAAHHGPVVRPDPFYVDQVLKLGRPKAWKTQTQNYMSLLT